MSDMTPSEARKLLSGETTMWNSSPLWAALESLAAMREEWGVETYFDGKPSGKTAWSDSEPEAREILTHYRGKFGGVSMLGNVTEYRLVRRHCTTPEVIDGE